MPVWPAPRQASRGIFLALCLLAPFVSMLRHALAVVLILAAVGAGLCLLDDHVRDVDFCLMLVVATVTITATVALMVSLAEVHAPASGGPRSFPHQARPAPI